ncbi:MAG: hypothetical protein ACFFGZ_13745 [Candidatus Thorarchaeota archaeon]
MSSKVRTSIWSWIPLFTISFLLTTCAIAIRSFYQSDKKVTGTESPDAVLVGIMLGHYCVLVILALSLATIFSSKFNFSLLGIQLAVIVVAAITLGLGMGLVFYYTGMHDHTWPFNDLGNALVLFASISLVLSFSLLGLYARNKASLSIVIEENPLYYAGLLVVIGHSILFAIAVVPAFFKYGRAMILPFLSSMMDIPLLFSILFVILIFSLTGRVKVQQGENETSKMGLNLPSLTKWQVINMGIVILGAITALLALPYASSRLDKVFFDRDDFNAILVLLLAPTGAALVSLVLFDLRETEDVKFWSIAYGLYIFLSLIVYLIILSSRYRLGLYHS